MNENVYIFQESIWMIKCDQKTVKKTPRNEKLVA